jgi:hypothetical protein
LTVITVELGENPTIWSPNQPNRSDRNSGKAVPTDPTITVYQKKYPVLYRSEKFGNSVNLSISWIAKRKQNIRQALPPSSFAL